MQYWLMKSEPEAYSIDHLQKDKITPWDGVRNYQVRNMMRDQMQVGDLAFFYHSNAKPPGIAGMMEIVKTGYPDHTAFDPTNMHFDPKSSSDDPRWYMVDVKFKKKFKKLIALQDLREHPALESMQLLRKGSRLSVTPLTEEEWNTILTMANV